MAAVVKTRTNAATGSKMILLADAAFLSIIGGLQMVLELLGHFAHSGIYSEQFANSPYTIGFFEAHGLAFMIGISVFLQHKQSNRGFWHGFLLLMHLLLGGANLLFWQSFVAFNFIPQGIIATAFHIGFIVANALILAKGIHND